MVLGLLLPIIGLLVYIFKPKMLFIYWILVNPILCPVLCLAGGIYDLDGTVDFLSTVPGYLSYLFIVIILLRFSKHQKSLYSLKKSLIILLILCFYFFFQSIITNFSLQYIYLNIKEAVFIILPLMVMIFDKRTIPDLKHVFVVVSFIAIVELLFVFLNSLGVRTYVAWYEHVLRTQEFENLATGTFFNGAGLADWICVLFLFVSVDFFSRRVIPFKYFLTFTVVSSICLLAAGSRMPIVLTAISFTLLIFLYAKKYKFLFVFILLIAFGTLNWLGSYQGGEISKNDGVNRIVEGLTSFTQNKKNKEDDGSTVRLSEKLIDEYFYRAPLFGNGRESLGDKAYSISDSLSEVTNLRADAHFAFMLVEFGIVGLLLYLLYFYNIFRDITRGKQYAKKIVTVVFVSFTIFSITEGGLWDNSLFPYTYIYFLGLSESEGKLNILRGL